MSRIQSRADPTVAVISGVAVGRIPASNMAFPTDMPRKMFVQANEATNESFRVAGEFISNVESTTLGLFDTTTGAVHQSGRGMIHLSNNITDITLGSIQGSLDFSCNSVDLINNQTLDFLFRVLNLCEKQFDTFFQGLSASLVNSGALGEEVARRSLDSGLHFAIAMTDMNIFITTRIFDFFIDTNRLVQQGCDFGFHVLNNSLDNMVGMGQIQDNGRFANQAGRETMMWITNVSDQILCDARNFILQIYRDSTPMQESIFGAVFDATKAALTIMNNVGAMCTDGGVVAASGSVKFAAMAIQLVRETNNVFWAQSRDAIKVIFGALNGGRDVIFPWVNAVWDQSWNAGRSFVHNGVEVGVIGARATMGLVDFSRSFALRNVYNIIDETWILTFNVFEMISVVGEMFFETMGTLFRVPGAIAMFNEYDSKTLRIGDNVVRPIMASVRKADAEILMGETFRHADPMFRAVGAM